MVNALFFDHTTGNQIELGTTSPRIATIIRGQERLLLPDYSLHDVRLMLAVSARGGGMRNRPSLR